MVNRLTEIVAHARCRNGRFEVVLSRSVCTLDKKEFVEHSDPERTRANIPLFQQGIMIQQLNSEKLVVETMVKFCG